MKVTFVYSGGREWRGFDGPSDFFYGARELAGNLQFDIEYVDLDASPADPLTALVGGVVGKWLPPRTSADWIARCRRVLPRLNNADVVVATSTEVSFGLAFWKALQIFQKPLVGILCGAVNYPIGTEYRRKFVSNLLKKFHPVLFADAELSELERRFDLPADFTSVCWFGVDAEFWTLPAEGGFREGVLAVGNDSRRDFKTLLEAARLSPDTCFTVVTRRKKPEELPGNVNWRRGDWREAPISDEELRSLYQRAACVVVPLEECIQPSGQSVAMQAMMCGAPVVHTKTQGWWGGNVIRDGEHVRFVQAGNPVEMMAAIKQSMNEKKLPLSRQALLEAKWTSKGFAIRLHDIIAQIANKTDTISRAS